jgi:enoyl-CoA hydratase/carnithine racemase
MDEPVLRYETKFDGRVVVMTLNRPERRNALSPELSAALVDGWERFAADDEAWVAIVTGAGDQAFCAGMDLKARADRDRTGAPPPPPRRAIYPLSETLGLWKPTIAAINGYCIAGGWMLAQQCDVRIAAEHAQLGITETRWNQAAAWVHNLPSQMLLGHALEIALWGDRLISAQRAYEIGWVNRVVPGERLMEEALGWAERMLSLAPRAVRNLKEILYRGAYLTPLEGRAFGRALEQNLAGMEDTKEGPRAFAEKRKPNFQNR